MDYSHRERPVANVPRGKLPAVVPARLPMSEVRAQKVTEIAEEQTCAPW
jgi:hypothetical protein